MTSFLTYIQTHVSWIVAFCAASLSLIVGVSSYTNALRARRRLGYKILVNTALKAKGNGSSGGTQVLFNGREVKDVQLIKIEFKNTGMQSFRPSDFASPIYISIPDAEVLEADISETFPDVINTSVSISGSDVTIAPTLMNPSDYFTVSLLVTRPKVGDVLVRGHIAGVARLTKL